MGAAPARAGGRPCYPPLQLEEAKLALLKAENDYRHARFKLGLAILELWAGCGRELPALLGGLLN